MRTRSQTILTRLVVGLAMIAGLLGSVGLTAQAQAETAPLTVYSTACPDSAYSGRNLDSSQCMPVQGVTYTLTTADGDVVGECVTTELDNTGTSATCTISGVPYESDVSVTQDDSALPAGVEPTEDNPATIYTSIPQTALSLSLSFVNRLLETEEPVPAATEAEPSVESVPVSSGAPTATETLTAETDGSTAAIFAGDCGGDFTGEPVATLTNVRAPDGETRGADDTSAVETSFTALDLPLDDILADDHVLVVFDEDDDTVALACGAIGGMIGEDGSLSFGLRGLGESRYSGVAVMAPVDDRTLTSIFLAEDLSPDATPAT